jgi:hypothetical protein
MVRPLIILAVVLAVIGGVLFALAGRAREKQPTHVEKVVSLGDLKK